MEPVRIHVGRPEMANGAGGTDPTGARSELELRFRPATDGVGGWQGSATSRIGREGAEADDVAQAGQGEQAVELVAGIAQPHLASEAPGGQLEPRQPVDRGCVRRADAPDVADEHLAVRWVGQRGEASGQEEQIRGGAWRPDVHDPDGETLLPY